MQFNISLTVKFLFIKVNKNSPEFHSKYHSCEVLLTLEIKKLDLFLHQEGIQEIMKFVSELQSQLKLLENDPTEMLEKQSSEILKRTLSTLSENMPSLNDINRRKRASKTTKVETILLKLKAKFDGLMIKMFSDKNNVAMFDIKGLETEIIMKKSYTDVKVKLVDISVMDLNPKTFHPKVSKLMLF